MSNSYKQLQPNNPDLAFSGIAFLPSLHSLSLSESDLSSILGNDAGMGPCESPSGCICSEPDS